MGRRFYLAEHESQRNTGVMARTNCAAASGAMLADQWSLGLKDPGVAWFRKQTDDFEGGLRMEQVAGVLEELGVTVRLYDHRDNLKWSKLRSYLERGWFAVVAGDYDVLPPGQQGTDYDGDHAVVYHQAFKESQRVGDPLRAGWVAWPKELAYQYVAKFDRQTTGGIYATVMVPRYAILRDTVVEAELLARPEKDAPVIGTLKQGHKLVTGGVEKGDVIAGNDRWRRVWVPSASRVGYIHWAVSWTA